MPAIPRWGIIVDRLGYVSLRALPVLMFVEGMKCSSVDCASKQVKHHCLSRKAKCNTNGICYEFGAVLGWLYSHQSAAHLVGPKLFGSIVGWPKKCSRHTMLD